MQVGVTKFMSQRYLEKRSALALAQHFLHFHFQAYA